MYCNHHFIFSYVSCIDPDEAYEELLTTSLRKEGAHLPRQSAVPMLLEPASKKYHVTNGNSEGESEEEKRSSCVRTLRQMMLSGTTPRLPSVAASSVRHFPLMERFWSNGATEKACIIYTGKTKMCFQTNAQDISLQNCVSQLVGSKTRSHSCLDSLTQFLFSLLFAFFSAF